MPSSRTEMRRSQLQRAPLAALPGEKVVAHFDSAFAPCRCVTHHVWTIGATTVAWRAQGERYMLRCLSCDHEWSRQMLPDCMGKVRPNVLVLDASHPEERAARAARRSS